MEEESCPNLANAPTARRHPPGKSKPPKLASANSFAALEPKGLNSSLVKAKKVSS